MNALKAASIAIHALDAQREKFREGALVRSPIITKGGDSANVVPSKVRTETMVRGHTVEARQSTSELVDSRMRAGAMAMGATVETKTAGPEPPRNGIRQAHGAASQDRGRTFTDVFKATDEDCDLFDPDMCWSYCKAAGCGTG